MNIKYCKHCKRETPHHQDGGCLTCAYTLISEETGLSFSQIKYQTMALKDHEITQGLIEARKNRDE